MSEERVPCPVCKGQGHIAKQPPNGCQCCGGQGTITKQRDQALAKVRKDLAQRIRDRGWHDLLGEEASHGDESHQEA